MRELIIQSDGTPNGTTILSDDGEVIRNVTEASFHVGVGNVGMITLEIAAAAAQVTGQLEDVMFTCPVCDDYVYHKCDETLGPSKPVSAPTPVQSTPSKSTTQLCNDQHVTTSPGAKGILCVMPMGHTRLGHKHFDGDSLAWL